MSNFLSARLRIKIIQGNTRIVFLTCYVQQRTYTIPTPLPFYIFNLHTFNCHGICHDGKLIRNIQIKIVQFHAHPRMCVVGIKCTM